MFVSCQAAAALPQFEWYRGLHAHLDAPKGGLGVGFFASLRRKEGQR